MTVTELAGLVVEAMGLEDVAFTFAGGTRGWLGDSPWVHLDTTRMKRLGWTARVPIAEGVRRTVRYLLEHPQIIAGRG
jgi:UDP-glucose 4-epimerase